MKDASWLLLALISIASSLFAAPALAADNTAEIQALLNRGGVVKIPAGVHTVGPLTVPGNVTSIAGAAPKRASTLKLKDNAGPWARILVIARSSDGDVAISISNLTVDMNRDAQGWQGKHDLEHQAAILLEADKNKRGVLTANIRDITINNSAGDGVYVHHGAHVDLADYDATDIFRGALVITGRRAVVVAKDCKWTRAGIDIEPNSDGDMVDVSLDGVECGKFDIGLTKSSKFRAANVTASGLLHLYCHPQAEFTCTDSTFNGRFKIRLAGTSTFERCKFIGPPGNTSNVINVLWSHKSLKSDQTLSFIDCKIVGPGTLGIDAGIDSPSSGNVLRLTDVAISGLPEGVKAQKGQKGVWEIKRSTLNGKPIR